MDDRKVQDVMNEIAGHERWLAGFKSPEPSGDAVHRALAAARGELAALNGAASRPHSPRHWVGVIGAAAAIAMAVGVTWYASARFDSTNSVVARSDPLPAWVSHSIAQPSAALEALDEDVADLEALSVNGGWDSGGGALYEAVEEVLNENADLDAG